MKPILRDFPDSFDSERLTIRSPRPGDGPALYQAIQESIEELRPWLPWANSEDPKPENAEITVRRAHTQFLSREDLMLFLTLKETGQIIGGSGLHRIDWSIPKFEIGYWIHTAYSGKGYVTEAVEAITQFAFEQLGAERVEIRCDSKNIRSAAIPRRLGFTHEGTLRADSRNHITNELRDTLIFAKTKDKG